MFLGLFLGICILSQLTAALVWRPGEGWVDETSGQGLSASSSRDQLDLAKKLEEKGEIDDAMKAYRLLVRKWPLSFFAPEAQYKVGEMLEKKAEFWQAYKAYQKMVDKYPASTLFDQAMGRLFAIGNLYLAGEPQKLWKIPVGPSMDKTVEIYQSIIKAAPYGSYAPEAQFKIGLAREKQKKYTDAVVAYNRILDKYPGNAIADDAQYQIGYTWMRASSDADYDQSAAEKAAEAFEDFMIRFPNSEKVAAAREHIESLRSKQNQGNLNIARFYEKQRNYKAAFVYYNEVVRQNPESANAELAKKKIEELRPLVEKAETGGENADKKTPPSPSLTAVDGEKKDTGTP
jgi:outer membrane protein assembly factor BamD